MKLALLAIVFLTGCRFPSGTTSAVALTVYGAAFGYDPGTHLPALYVGLIHETAHNIPTNAPPVTESLSLEQHWLSTSVFEEFATGGETIPTNSVAKIRAAKLK